MQFIDLWDIQTYPENMKQAFIANKELIRGFYASGSYCSNAISSQYNCLINRLAITLQNHTVRAWHYTKLCQFEIDEIKRSGTQLSTEHFLADRLNALVRHGCIDRSVADKIYHSNCMQEHRNGLGFDRIGNFHLVPEPLRPDNVGDITRYWGGEAAYAGQNQDIVDVLKDIGRACVIEIALPVKICREHQGNCFADEMISFYAAKMGYRRKATCFQLFIQKKIPAENILHIHQEDGDEFTKIGSGYPVNYPIG